MKIYYFYEQAAHEWRLFCRMYWLLNRHVELERLIAWAKRKRLCAPQQAYERQLLDTEMRLNHLQVRALSVTRWARLIHRVGTWIAPRPRHYACGVAAAYRR